jgi:hypothetical protein
MMRAIFCSKGNDGGIGMGAGKQTAQPLAEPAVHGSESVGLHEPITANVQTSVRHRLHRTARAEFPHAAPTLGV